MNIIVGVILIIIGVFGTASSFKVLVETHKYSSLYTSADKGPMMFFIVSFIILLAGIIVVIFSIIKKRNEDKLESLTRINGSDSTGRILLKNKCPVCNLNVTDGCKVCPQCGNVLNKEE